MTSIYLVVGAVEVDMAPWAHAARATSNNITGPCNSFRFTNFAHFTFGHVSVHYPFRQKERRKKTFFAQIAHKVFHLGQYR